MKIAHISDLHLTTLHHIGWPELLNKRILGYLSWRYRRRHIHKREILDQIITLIRGEDPALLAITGDLTHIGTRGECQQVETWLAEIVRTFDIALIPGNHDCYTRADYADTIGRWQRYFPGQAVHDSATFPSLRRIDDIAVIGVNTALPTAPFLATGKVGKTQLAALAELLRSTGQAGLFRLVLLHHGPVAGTYRNRKRLVDEAAVTDLIKQYGAEMILHGHGHNMVEQIIEANGKHIPVSGVASGSAVANRDHPPAGYKLYDIHRAQQGWTVDCRSISLDADNGPGQVVEQHYLIASNG
ncbi:MAG: metallophosphoesterase family protein [Gammaproteobacteria bacterium]